MQTKEELVENIKEWIKIDGDIAKLQSEVKEKRNKKKSLTESLVEVMKKNEIDCFDINGGSLVYKKNKVKKAINAKTLMTSLKTYFAANPQQAEDLTKFVMDSREEQVKETIKRKIDK
jgi:hypothetical protein